MEDIKIKKNEMMPNFPKTEGDILAFWKENNIFQKSIDQRDKTNPFTFYDGPITSNNKPHYGHALTMVIKDVVPRYKTMRGYHVDRSLGWDCQGIPVEYEVEKTLGFEQKEDIEKFGIEKFNQMCRESVQKYQGEIFALTERMGRWVNKDEEYATMDPAYIESVWWSLSELYKKGLLYQGYKVVPYSTRAGTTLSNSEVALGGYKAIIDPAVTVSLKLKDSDTYLLIWTTTPWTLPGNLLVAVGNDFEYVEVEHKGRKYIVGKTLAEKIFGEDNKVLNEMLGKDLVGKEYEPLYPYYAQKSSEGCFRVVHAEHVTLEDGTGLVHQAPYGEEDFALMTGMEIEMFDYLDDQGNMKDEITQFAGMFYKKANKYVMQDLEERGLLFAHEDHEHQMPMCWRTETPLIYKPIKSWYVRVSEIRKRMTEENNEINWIPEHIKDGRFGNWLADARDWALSRNRYWGTPLPAWICDKCGATEVLGSFAEIKDRSGVELTDPHKPFVDEVKYACSKCDGEMHRVTDVIDVWYDSGSMPFARFHYPFENKEKFEQKYPAEFIAEGVDQTRGWFYTLHVLGTALFDQKAFKNVVVNGLALASDGSKMSKSKRNYTDINIVIDQLGADSMRLYFLSSPIVHGEEVIFNEKFLKEIMTSVMLPYWNSVKYLLSYQSESKLKNVEELDLSNVMDRWIVARLHKTIGEVTKNMDAYDLQPATKSIFDLIDDLSKWYIRRSRERFVNGDVNALDTLRYVLVEISKLLAPFAPFLAESAYQTLVSDEKESVHLEDYSKEKSELLNDTLLSDMKKVREICSLGLTIRDTRRIKVRQPLAKAFVSISDPAMQEIIQGELNVKGIEYVEKPKYGRPQFEEEYVVSSTSEPIQTVFITLDIKISEELKAEGFLNELTRGLQVARKESGCQVGQDITVKYQTESKEIEELISSHLEELAKVVLAKSFEKVEALENGLKLKLAEYEVFVEIIK